MTRPTSRCTSSVILEVEANKRARSFSRRASLTWSTSKAAQWRASKPVVRGKKAISLERQVRIAAGMLVLLGAVLGWFAHPAFIGLSAFVGAGLVFAGITDACGLGMILARMPWNQVKEAAGPCCTKKEVCS